MSNNYQCNEDCQVEDKRKYYKCAVYFTLKDITTWDTEQFEDSKVKHTTLSNIMYTANREYSQRISLFYGSITSLEIDVIVNAANNELRGGGGVDGAIHNAAGNELLNYCKTLNGCKTGEAKITSGYRLPAKFVIHTVGPKNEHPDLLRSCYDKCLDIFVKQKCRSIAFPCISTGIYNYPKPKACIIALTAVRNFFDEIADDISQIDRVIFCTYEKDNYDLYRKQLNVFFPSPY
ncbi:hypothetical protein GJ496_002133 [Pomphorhynchus laevis]|nr:hypothetical protein GJ496_002133 [Pomphorhynchus laevis]